MPKQVQDQFTSMPISRQRRYQLRQEEHGCCRICGNPGAPYCKTHRKLQRKYSRNGPKDTPTPDPWSLI